MKILYMMKMIKKNYKMKNNLMNFKTSFKKDKILKLLLQQVKDHQDNYLIFLKM